MKYLYEGVELYHKNRKMFGQVIWVKEPYFKIVFNDEKPVNQYISNIGAMYFFKERDEDTSPRNLCKMEEYIECGNNELKELLSKIKKAEEDELKMAQQQELMREAQERKEREEKRKREEEITKEITEIGEEWYIEKNNRKELLRYLQKEFCFDGFHHYTDFTNFIKIFKGGKLYSRNRAKEVGFLDAADQKVIGQTDEKVFKYVRFYYKEQTPTLHNNEGIKHDGDEKHMPLPVLLLFKEDIILHPNTRFLTGCGGSKYTTCNTHVSNASNYEWSTIFSRGPIEEDVESIMMWGYDVPKAKINNKRNAEFHYRDEISVEYLKKIIFRSEADMKRAEDILGKNNLFELNKGKFNNKNSYLDNYEVRFGEDKMLEVYFKFYGHSINYYKHRVEIFYEDGDIFEEYIGIDNGWDKQHFARIIETMCQMDYNGVYVYKKKLDRSIKELRYYMNEILSMVWNNEELS